MSLLDSSIKELETQLHNKEVSVTDLVDASYNRIEEVDGDVQAFLTLNEENAREQAKQLDKETTNSDNHPLFGIPAGIKDNIVTKALRTTCASQMLRHFDDPLYNATVIEKLQAAKSINIGKLNLDEFAMGSSNENSSFTPTRNPWNTDYVPGGSSGGSAAAVAAGEVLYSLGSDTSGSIRQPASFCGVVGLKPTYGRVSRFGLVALASSLDQIGPVTRSVEDNARVLEVIAGQDPMDMTSANVEVPRFSEALNQDVKGLKIAVPKEYFEGDVSEEVKKSIMDALKMYESLGAEWEEVSLPHTKYAVPAYNILSAAEASASLARFDGVRYGERSEKATDMTEMYKLSRSEGFGEEVKRRILLGTYALSSGAYDAYYEKAQKVRTLIKQDFDSIFADYDVVIGPTTPTSAFKVGEQTEKLSTTNDALTVPANLAGLPAISIPCGFSNESMPLGLQIIGNYFDEQTIYRTAYAFEQATDYHTKKPQLGGANK